MGNLKWIVVALGILIALFLVSRSMQSGYTTQPDAVFPDDADAIKTVELWTKGDTLTLERKADGWSLAGIDTLVVRENRIEQLFDRVLKVKKETMVSKNPAKWETFAVTDTSGSHIRLLDAKGEEMGYAVFGRSMSDWSKNYVRTRGEDEVYLTDQSVMHIIYPRAAYWGEKPAPPPEESEDSSAVEADSVETGM